MDPEKQLRADALAELQVDHRRFMVARDVRDAALIRARDAGCTLVSIGIVMDTTKQNAYERYRRLTQDADGKRFK